MPEDFQPIEMQQEMLPSPKKKNRLFQICVILVVILAIVSALLVKFFVIGEFDVDGPSMYPTLDGGNGALSDDDLHNGDRVYVNKISKIHRGDIVVFTKPNSTDVLVKRVIAIAGDHLRIVDGKVYLNDVLLDETYINEPMSNHDSVDIRVQDGFVYCLGDNRNNSLDSRAFGQVPLDNILGKCFAVRKIDGSIVWLK